GNTMSANGSGTASKRLVSTLHSLTCRVKLCPQPDPERTYTKKKPPAPFASVLGALRASSTLQVDLRLTNFWNGALQDRYSPRLWTTTLALSGSRIRSVSTPSRRGT